MSLINSLTLEVHCDSNSSRTSFFNSTGFAGGEDHNKVHHEEQQHEGHNDQSDRFGVDKAILEFKKEKGFRLSKESIEKLGIQFESMESLKFDIPKSAIAYIKNKKGFFLFKNKYFKFVELDKKQILQAKDRIVVQGTGLIAITDVFTKDQSEYGHSH